jgi:hypothetical protein
MVDQCKPVETKREQHMYLDLFASHTSATSTNYAAMTKQFNEHAIQQAAAGAALDFDEQVRPKTKQHIKSHEKRIVRTSPTTVFQTDTTSGRATGQPGRPGAPPQPA